MQPLPATAAQRGTEFGFVFRHRAFQRTYPGSARALALVRMNGGEEFRAPSDGGRVRAAEKAHPAAARVKLVVHRVVVPFGELAAVGRQLGALPRALPSAARAPA